MQHLLACTLRLPGHTLLAARCACVCVSFSTPFPPFFHHKKKIHLPLCALHLAVCLQTARCTCTRPDAYTGKCSSGLCSFSFVSFFSPTRRGYNRHRPPLLLPFPQLWAGVSIPLVPRACVCALCSFPLSFPVAPGGSEFGRKERERERARATRRTCSDTRERRRTRKGLLRNTHTHTHTRQGCQ